MNPLEGRALSRRFGGFCAVQSVDITVAAGEVVGLIGANGAGKTTLVRMLLGLIAPSEGQVLLFGEPPSLRTRRRLGYVPQGLGLYEDLTVEENLEFAAAVLGGEAAPHPDLAAVAALPVRDLSLGMRRRLAFAIARGHRPQLLILDEPTSGVAALGRSQLWDGIRGEAENGAGVLITTHHMNEAEQCDRLIVLAEGKVAASGSVEDIVAGAMVVEVRCPRWDQGFEALVAAGYRVALVGDKLRVPDAAAPNVAAALQEANIDAEFEVVPASFEERFVELAAQVA